MNNRAIWFAVLGALLGTAALMIYKKRFEEETSGGEPIPVIFATEDIPMGTAVTESMLATRKLPENYVEDRHIKVDQASRIIGVRTRATLKANESVLWSDLATTSESSRDLSGLVAQGMRAITIPTNSASTFGGLLRPGDRVDVLFHDSGLKDSTVPLLQNILILAAGSNMGQSGSSSSRAFNQVTLGVNLQQAQVLAHAKVKGELTLILRNPDDIKVLRNLPETSNDDLNDASKRENISAPSLGAIKSKEIEHVR
ncbi:MAG: Flp pilus assembly protein CpaB [Myxococcales bacterium]|nr:MAG: Flp pilus assembly protein CpaB [Myxococcales bacterium]